MNALFKIISTQITYRKKEILLIIISLFMTGSAEEISDNSFKKHISIASWNVRILSNNSRTDAELAEIARIIKRYDLTAVQEVRDTIVIDRLGELLSDYNYIVSPSVGNRVTERYAFFYRKELFTLLGTPYIYNDINDDFIREPYIAHFKAGNFDFTLVSIHVLYGTKKNRRQEIIMLDTVIDQVDNYNGAENDVILLGDFNFPLTESSFRLNDYSALIPAAIATTISDKSSYDNIWVDNIDTTELISLFEIYKFDEILYNNNDDLASLEVSDHRPVSALFSISKPDDDKMGSYNN